MVLGFLQVVKLPMKEEFHVAENFQAKNEESIALGSEGSGAKSMTEIFQAKNEEVLQEKLNFRVIKFSSYGTEIHYPHHVQ